MNNNGFTSRYVWSETNINYSMMGQYLTSREWGFIQDAISHFRSPISILDVGGGDGRFSRRLAKMGVNSIILERDDLPLRELAMQGWQKPVLLADGNVLPFREMSFDAVMVIENPACTDSAHLVGFLNSVHCILKPKGIIMFTSFNIISAIGLLKLLQPAKYSYSGSGEAYTESYSKTRNTLLRCGFRIQKAHGFRWIPGNRKSSSRLIPIFERVESALHLDRLAGISPWIFWVAEKKG